VPRVALERAREAAREALRLASSLPEAGKGGRRFASGSASNSPQTY
jgi:hypothetical protein